MPPPMRRQPTRRPELASLSTGSAEGYRAAGVRSAHVELVQMIRGRKLVRFVKSGVPIADLMLLSNFLAKLARAR